MIRRPTLAPVSPVAAVAACLAAVQLAVRAWVGFAGWFSLDDYVFYTRAAVSPLADPDFLFASYNGHFMPGSMVWVWLTTSLAPLNFNAVVVVSLLLQALVDVLAYLLLVRVFGRRPGVLVPYAVFVLTTVTLPAMVWWAAALNQLPEQLSMLLVLLAFTAYVSSGRVRDAVWSTLALLFGLAFSEKSVLVVPLVFMLAWLFVVAGPLGRSAWETVTRFRVLWLLYLAVVVPYGIYYAVAVRSPVNQGVDARDAVQLLDIGLRRTVVPGLFGGPWQWTPIGVVDSLAAPPVIAQVVCLAAAAVVVGYSLTRSSAARRAWSLAGLAFVVELALLLGTRVPVVGVEAVAAEYRYFTDFALVAALALGLAYLPAPGLTGETTGAHVAGVEATQTAADADRERVVALAAYVGVIVLAAGAVYSAGTYRERWGANPGRPYFAQAQGDLATVPGTVVYDGPVPTAVVWRLLWPATLPSRLLEPTGLEFRPLQDGESTAHLRDLDQTGHLRDSTVHGIEADPGPEPCGWDVDGTTTIPLPEQAFYWNWVVRIAYQADGNGTMTLRAGDTTTQVRYRSGDGQSFTAVVGSVDHVTLAGLPTTAGLCVSSLVVGLPQPVEW